MTEPVFPTEESTPLTLDGPAGAIEVIVEAAEAHARPLVAVLCHPLPTEGGTMHNQVVTIAARALRESGAATVRFNFRGVGQSEGTFDDGDGEADEHVDPAAVYAWLDGLKGLKNTPELVRMPETSHFFHRRLMDLRGAVKNGVRPYLPAVATMPDD